MWRYISPGIVFTSTFTADTTVKTGRIFKSIKKRGAGLASIDIALDNLKDHFRPKANPAETAAHLAVVLRQAKAWLRKMNLKKEKNAKESKARVQKRVAIQTLAREALDMLVVCSPQLSKALDSFNTHKAQGNQFQMKGLAPGYVGERNMYLKNNKMGSVSSGSATHDVVNDGFGRFSKEELKTLTSSEKATLKKIRAGVLVFESLTDQDYQNLFTLAKLKKSSAEVLFLDKLKRLEQLITIDNGRLVSADGKPFSGQDEPWAMDGHGNLFAGFVKGGNKLFNHSTFMAGKEVACAGLLDTSSTGQLLAINNGSGHYKPTIDNLREAVAFLDQEGVDLSQCEVTAQMFEQGQPYLYTYQATAFINNPNQPPAKRAPGRLQ